MLEYRVTFPDDDEEEKAVEILEKEGVDFDWDSGDRMMLNQEGLDLLRFENIDFDEV